MTANPQQRRKQIIVNKELQNRIVFAVSWPAALCLVLTSVALGVFCTRLSTEAMAVDAELPSLVPVFMTTAAFLVVATVFQLLSALKFSHRIAGPMYRMRKTFEAFRSGDLAVRANIRDGDYLREVADDINGFLDWLEQEHGQAFASRSPQSAQVEADRTEQSPETAEV